MLIKEIIYFTIRSLVFYKRNKVSQNLQTIHLHIKSLAACDLRVGFQIPQLFLEMLLRGCFWKTNVSIAL